MPVPFMLRPHILLSWEETTTWHSFVAHFRMEWLLIFHFLKER